MVLGRAETLLKVHDELEIFVLSSQRTETMTQEKHHLRPGWMGNATSSIVSVVVRETNEKRRKEIKSTLKRKEHAHDRRETRRVALTWRTKSVKNKSLR